MPTHALKSLPETETRPALLSAERETELAKRIENGDPEAFLEFFKANVGLVKSLGNRYGRHLPVEDRDQAGYEGLCIAIEKFNWRLGYKFSTYGSWWIRQRIQRADAEQRRNQAPLSLDKPIDGADSGFNTSLLDFVADTRPAGNNTEALTIAERQAQTIRQQLDRLPTRERTILALRFGFVDGVEWSFSDIATHLKLSANRVIEICICARSMLEDSLCGKPPSAHHFKYLSTNLTRGLSILEHKVLAHLAALKPDTLMSDKDLEGVFGTPVNVQTTYLHKRGFVVKTQHNHCVVLTEAGRDHAGSNLDSFDALLHELL